MKKASRIRPVTGAKQSHKTSKPLKSSALGDAKTAIFNAAKDLFASRGFEGVSVREIADAAGVHFGLVRYYFGGKPDLYRHCLRLYGERRLACANRLMEPAESAEEFSLMLHEAIGDILAVQLDDPSLTKIFLREVESSTSIADDVLGETVIVMARRFIAFFRAAQERGIVRADVDAQILTHMLQGTINHFVRTDSVRKRHFGFSVQDAASRNRLVAEIHGLLVNGIIFRSSKKEKRK